MRTSTLAPPVAAVLAIENGARDRVSPGVYSLTGDTGPCTPQDCGPAPAIRNYLCPDGMTVAEPGSYTEIGGGWGWEIIECPQSLCEPPDCGPPAASSTYLCPDGVTEAGPGDCVSVNGFCAWEWTQCTCWVPGDAPTCAVEAVCLADRTWSCGDMVPPNTARGELCAM